MAHVKSIDIYFDSPNRKQNTLKVEVSLKPSGRDFLEVDIPKDFHDCIIRIAQLAADLHEQKMRAQILADEVTA